MKKLVITALAIGAMASCTKSTVQYEQPGEISLQPVTQKATKAAIDGNDYPEEGHFKVWALWTANAAESSASAIPETLNDNYVEYINGGEFVKKKDPNSWGGVTPYYWPTTGSLFFAGYSPAMNSDNFDYSWETKTFTATNYEQSNNIAETKDLMWFDVTNQSYNNNNNSITEGETTKSVNGVPVKFKHALSWLEFRFNLSSESTPKCWKITNVTLKDIKTKANFTAALNATPEWNSLGEAKQVEIYKNNEGKLLEHKQEGDCLVDAAKKGVVVIPQGGTPKLQIQYGLTNSTIESTFIPQTVELDLFSGAVSEWEIGKHYIYNITFGGNEILIYPKVTDWTDVNQNIEVQ